MPRALAAAFAVVLVLFALPLLPAARADDNPPGGTTAEAPFQWDVIAVMPDDVPKGWTLMSDDAESRPAVEKDMAAAVKAAAETDKFPADELAVHSRSATGPEKASVTLTYVDLYKEPGKVPAAIKEAAAKKGWAYRELTNPTRILLVAGPEGDRDVWLTMGVRTAAKRLGAASMQSHDGESMMALAHAALALESGTASAHFALAMAARPQEDGAPPEAWKRCIEEARTALKDGMAIPLSKEMRPLTTGILGEWLLYLKGGDDVNKEARERLTDAWQSLKDGEESRLRAVQFRYNLACAIARLKDKDAAFEHLTGCLESLKDHPMRGISEWWRKDPDFDLLHDDPRWKALEEKYPDNSSGTGE